MRRIVLFPTIQRIASLLLMLVLGVGIARTFQRWFITFKPIGYAVAGMTSGGMGGIIYYESGDGVPVTFTSMGFPDRDLPEMAFRDELGQATSIIERAPLYNQTHGTVRGERVLGMFRSNDPENPEWVMLVVYDRDNARVIEIASPSLRHVRA